jgi:predicted permease
MNPWVRFSHWLHRRLARAFPHEFQLLHGDELEQMGDDAIPFVWRQFGPFGLLRILGAAAVGLISEYVVELKQDLRYSARRLMASRGFAAIGILSLALSIGMASLFILQMVDMNRPAPGIEDPDRMLATESLVAYRYFEGYREEREAFQSAGAFLGPTAFTVRSGAFDESSSERVNGHLVSLDYFSTLGVTSAQGRLLGEQDAPGSPPSVVISDVFWRNRLGGDPKAVGSMLRVNGGAATIVGIMPPGFRGAFPQSPADIFVPVTIDPSRAPELRNNLLDDLNAARFRVVLRLKEGVTRTQGEAAIQVITRNLDQLRPESERPREERTVALLSGGIRLPLSAETRRILWGSNGLIFTMILGMACTNLAVLLLARSSERRKEVAIRLSSGASRFRLFRQMLTESVLLALAGGVAGLFVVYSMIKLTGSLRFPSSAGPEPIMSSLDGFAAALVLAVSVATGVAFGMVPALSAVRGEFFSALKGDSQAQLRNYSRFGIRNQFMLFQVSSSLMLMLITGFVVVGYQQSFQVDAGFSTEDLYLVDLDPARDGYTLEQTADLLEQLDQRVESLTEISASAVSLDLPFSQMVVIPNRHVSVDDSEDKESIKDVARQRIGPGYFAALGVPLVQGREFGEQDRREASADRETPIVLNQTAAQRLFGAQQPLGQRVREDDRTYAVVGVVKDLKSGLMMATPAPTMFVPVTAEDISRGAIVTVLVRGLPGAAVLSVVDTELTAFSGLTPFNARTFERDGDQFNDLIEWSSLMNGGIGAFGMLLSVIGLFSVTIHAVARRRKEIGVRVALGARRDQILRLVLREGGGLIAIGGIFGFAGAYALSQAFSAVASRLADIFAIGTGDPLFTIAAPLAWGALAFIACYLPARRALSIDPASTLKAE